MNTRPVTSAELAERLGHPVDWLYRNLARLYANEGLPRPLLSTGRNRWDRASIDAWFARHHPFNRPANDLDAPPTPANDGAWRRRLADAYGPS